MLTNQEADWMVRLQKISPVESLDLYKANTHEQIYSATDKDFEFDLLVYRSRKVSIKLVCHMQTGDYGIMRLDMKGRHRNPSWVSRKVPDFLKEYAGEVLEYDSPHIHIYVEGYGLDWAIPATEYGTPFDQLSEKSDTDELLTCFQKAINLKYPMNIILPRGEK